MISSQNMPASKSLLYSRFFLLFSHFSVIFYSSNAQEEFILFEITTFNERERRILYAYHISDDEAYFINGITNEAALSIIVLTRPAFKQRLITFLKTHEIQFSYDEHTMTILAADPDISDEDIGNFPQQFHDYNEVETWVNESLAVYPKELQKIVIGKSFENRELFILKVGKEPKNFAVFILGGEQGRDWATPAMIINMVDEILHRQGILRPLIQLYEFYFMPFMNPDGYEYSRKQDRFWLMNRKVIKGSHNCKKGMGIGVAIDRNWFFKTRPAEDICAGVNIGQEPLSEQESKALSRYLNKIAPKLLAFINLRGFGRYITIPYGFTELPVNNHKILMQIVDSAVKNKNYYYETSNFLLLFEGKHYNISVNFTGSCPDWVKRELNVPFVCTIYSNPPKSIIPKESDIQPLTKDASEIIATMLEISKDIYGPLFNSIITHSSCNVVWVSMFLWTVYY